MFILDFLKIKILSNDMIKFLTLCFFMSFLSFFVNLFAIDIFVNGIQISFPSSNGFGKHEIVLIIVAIICMNLLVNFCGVFLAKTLCMKNSTLKDYFLSAFLFTTILLLIFILSSRILPITSWVMRSSGIGEYFVKIKYSVDPGIYLRRNFAVVANVNNIFFVEAIKENPTTEGITKKISVVKCGKILEIPLSKTQAVSILPGIPDLFCRQPVVPQGSDS